MDRVVTIVAAVAAPVLGLLVDIHAISPTVSLDIGGIVATAVSAYHGGKAVQRRAAAPAARRAFQSQSAPSCASTPGKPVVPPAG